MRTLLLWCPDWPVIAAGIVDGVPAHDPVAVMRANRVLACSPAARVEGVRRGLRKREAQGRCPHLVLVDHDPGRDARAFEPVVAAVEELAPGVEIIRPGACAVAARGPAGYYGGEAVAAERLVEHTAVVTGVEVQAGVADGSFAAMLAARAGHIVPPGQTPTFLAAMDISVLAGSAPGRAELVDLLRRLGIATIGDFTAIPAGDVLARFGFDAAYVHRLATGIDDRPLAVRVPPVDLGVTGDYDPPLDRVDLAAFAARALADRLHQRLAAHGLAATRLAIEARTSTGEVLHRLWRHEGLLDGAALADRVRWQLDGWLTATSGRPTSGIERLRLEPDGLVRQAGLQAGLWGEVGAADERAHRALVRVQGLLGPESVFTATVGGGRGPVDRVRLVAWGDEKAPVDSAPWPGRLPAPAPAVVPAQEVRLTVLTAAGQPVRVDERLNLNDPPARVAVAKERPAEVVGWAGPWPVQERWWSPGEARRLARLQLLLADGRALLVATDADGWLVEAFYD